MRFSSCLFIFLLSGDMRLLCFFLFHDLLICCIHPQLTHQPTHAPSTYPPTHTSTPNLPTDPHMHPQLTHRPTHAPSTLHPPSTYPPTHTCTLNLPTDPHIHPQLTHRPTKDNFDIQFIMHPQLTHRPTHAPSTYPPTHTCTLNLPTDPHMHLPLTHRPTHAHILPPPLMSYHTLNCLYDKFSVSNPYLPFSCSLDNLGQCTNNRKNSIFIVSIPIKEQLNSKII